MLSEFYQFKARAALGKWQKLSRRHYVPNELQTHQDYIYRQGAAPRTRVLIPTQRRINLSSKIGFKRIVRSQKIHSFPLAWVRTSDHPKVKLWRLTLLKSNFNFICGLVYPRGWLRWRNLSITLRIASMTFNDWASFRQIVWTSKSSMPMWITFLPWIQSPHRHPQLTDRNQSFVASINIYLKNNLECTQLWRRESHDVKITIGPQEQWW